MNIFKRLFKRNKNTIDMSAEEAYSPESLPQPETLPTPDAGDVSDAVQPVQTEPLQTETAPAEAAAVEAEPSVTLETLIFSAMESSENPAELVRPGMRSMFDSLSESSRGFEGTDHGAHVSGRILEENEVRASAEAIRTALASAPALNKDLLNAVLLQLSQFNVCFQLHISAPVEAAEDLRARLESKISDSIKGFYIHDGSMLYHRDGRLLMSRTGATEFEWFMPIRYSAESSEETRQMALSARAIRSREAMASHEIPCDVSLSAELSEDDIDLRPTMDIVRRAAALLCVCLTARAYTSPREITSPLTWSVSLIKRFNERFLVSSAFSPKEKAYVDAPSKDQHSAYLQRSEACAVLLWSLGLMPLSWPDTPADLGALNNCLKDTDMNTLCASVHIRSAGELADAYDLTARLHALCVRSDLRQIADTHLDPDIIYERHYALNWLLGVNGITRWDSVIPKT